MPAARRAARVRRSETFLRYVADQRPLWGRMQSDELLEFHLGKFRQLAEIVLARQRS
jgi:hypothetical protein